MKRQPKGVANSIVILLVYCCACERQGSQNESKSIHKVSCVKWIPMAGDLQVRYGSDSDHILLFRQIPGGLEENKDAGNDAVVKYGSTGRVLYRYDVELRALSTVDEKNWLGADGEITMCEQAHAGGPPPDDVRIDGEARLTVGDKHPETAGKTVLTLSYCPKKSLLAVTSAAGKIKLSPIPFMGGGSVEGPYYLQLFKYPDLTQAGDTLTMPTFSGSAPCWMFDGRYLVFVTPGGIPGWVVEVTAKGLEK